MRDQVTTNERFLFIRRRRRHQQLYKLVTPAAVTKDTTPLAAKDTDMEMDGVSSRKSTKSFGKTDKNGQYPVWMSQRNVKRLQKKNGKKKLQKKRNQAKK